MGTAQSRAVLQAWFETGDTPTEAQFDDLIASFSLVSERYLVYSTVALMKASTAASDGQLIFTRGYTAAYDGGWNLYWYRATGRTGVTIDNGFYIQGPGSDDYFEAVEKTVANIRKFGAKADGSDDATAIQAAVDSEAKIVYAPAGTYYIGSTIEFDVAAGEVPYALKGDGPKVTVFKPRDDFTVTNAMFSVINGSTTEYLAYGLFEDFQVWAQKDDAVTEVAYGFDADSCIHSTFARLRFLYGAEGTFTIGRSFTNSFEDCLFQNSPKFGFVATDGVFNQNSFRRSTFLFNTEAGFYCRAGFENSFVACGFEHNNKFGAFINRLRGCEFTGCYWEGNGDTKHTFTTVNLGALDGANWAVSGALCICGIASPPTDALPTDMGISQPSNGITINGSLWTPNISDPDTSFLIMAGGERVNLNYMAYGANYIPSQHTLLELYGAHNLAKGVVIRDEPDITTDSGNALKLNVQENPSVHTTDPGDWFSASHRYSWVDSQPVTEINLTDFQKLSGDGSWTYSGHKYKGWPMFFAEHTTTSGYFGTQTAWSLEDHPELRGKRCVCEVFYYPMCDLLSAGSTFWTAGLQVRVSSDHGFIENQDGSASVDANTIETTGSVSISSTSLTVASAAGMTVGAPIIVAGAGSPTDLTTFITAISGTTITLEDAAAAGVTDAVVLVPTLHVSRVIFYPDSDVADQDIRVRKVSGDNSQRMLVAKVIVREIGSEKAVIPYYDNPELRLEGEVIAFGTAVGTGDGQLYLRVPLEADDMRLTSCHIAHGNSVASSGTTTVTLTKLQAAGSGGSRNETAMLTTALTIDANEWDSKDASTPAVIDSTSNAEVNHGAIIRVDVDAAGSGAEGLYISLGFRKVDP